MNMMKKTSGLLTALVMSTMVIAQGTARIKVRMGMEGAGDARLPAIGLVKTGANAVLVQRQEVDAEGVWKGRLELYDRAKLGFLRAQPPVEKLTNGAKVVPDRVVAFAGRTIMMARAFGSGGTDLYYQLLEPNITKLPPPYEKLCSWPVVSPAPTAVDPGNYEYVYAQDSSLLLIQSPMLQAPSGGKAMLAVWNADLSIRWQHVLPAADGSIRSSVLGAAVDSSGTAFVLVSDRMAKSNVLDGKPTGRITLYRIGKDGSAAVPVPLDREKFLTHAVLRRAPNGTLLLGGVYGLVKDDRIQTQGDLITTIGADGQVAEPLLIPHAEEGGLVAEGEPAPVEGQKFVEKDVERLMTGIRLVDVLPKKNGGYYLVKELYFMETYFDLKAKRQANRYIHGPVQVTSVGKGGGSEWNSLFRRWFKSALPSTGDVLAGIYGDELFLFVLDSDEMAAARKAGGKMSPDMMKDPYSAHIGFDAAGVAKVKAVLRSGTETGFMAGQRLFQFAPGEFYAIGSEKPEGGRTLPVRIDLSAETK